MELTVENMFTEHLYEVRETIVGACLTPVDRKRMLSHVMADITHRIMSMPFPNPVGLTITVQLIPGGSVDEPLDLLVTATCPKYELDERFFSD